MMLPIINGFACILLILVLRLSSATIVNMECSERPFAMDVRVTPLEAKIDDCTENQLIWVREGINVQLQQLLIGDKLSENGARAHLTAGVCLKSGALDLRQQLFYGEHINYSGGGYARICHHPEPKQNLRSNGSRRKDYLRSLGKKIESKVRDLFDEQQCLGSDFRVKVDIKSQRKTNEYDGCIKQATEDYQVFRDGVANST